jgi:hypothetical protein
MLALPFAHHEYNLKLIKRLYLARTKDEKFLKQLNPIKIRLIILFNQGKALRDTYFVISK